MLNFSTITYMERQNAEMYYLSRIAQELASAPEEEEKAILERHARWKELCERNTPLFFSLLSWYCADNGCVR